MSKFDFSKHVCQVDPELVTEPDQTLSVREILRRFAYGQDFGNFHPSDDDPEGLSEDEQFDLDIPEDDFELRDFILESSEIARAHASEGSGYSDGSGNNQSPNSSNLSKESKDNEPSSVDPSDPSDQ